MLHVTKVEQKSKSVGQVGPSSLRRSGSQTACIRLKVRVLNGLICPMLGSISVTAASLNI